MYAQLFDHAMSEVTLSEHPRLDFNELASVVVALNLIAVTMLHIFNMPRLPSAMLCLLYARYACYNY